MSDTHTRVGIAQHEKMKSISKEKGIDIKEVYAEAIEEYIKLFEQEKIVADSKLEEIIDARLNKLEKHLASMLGKTGLDVAMILTGLARILEDTYNEDPADIYENLRKFGAAYYTQKGKK